VDERTFVAIINYQEEPTAELPPIEMLEHEFGWLEQSGMRLTNCALLDDYDVRWERYLLFLVQWAIDHNSDEYEGMSPPSYDEWRNKID